jgi:hypothetical protein
MEYGVLRLSQRACFCERGASEELQVASLVFFFREK